MPAGTACDDQALPVPVLPTILRTTTITTTDTPRLFRRTDGKLVAGVAAGMAGHLGLNVLAVRIGFVVLSFFSGLGVVLYAACWAVVPQQPAEAPEAAPGGKRAGELRGQLIAFAALAAGLLFVVQQANVIGRSELVWPIAVAVVGVALIWRQADDAQRTTWQRLVGGTDAGRTVAALRIVVGALLVIAGLTSVLAVSGSLASVRDGVASTTIILVGVAVVTGPWWWRTWSELTAERRERIRSQERAELAAHIHDSVLHTLALIQRRIDDPREVARLARGQERELRSWMYKPTGSPDERLAAALDAAAAEVEDTYGVSVEPVVVGDCPVDDRIGALVQATREALINAAKHAGVSAISLYAEVEDDQVMVFVRDRGKGFDPAAVDADRHGVTGSIIGRMKRHGGTADVRSTPDVGTEVRLTMAMANG